MITEEEVRAILLKGMKDQGCGSAADYFLCKESTKVAEYVADIAAFASPDEARVIRSRVWRWLLTAIGAGTPGYTDGVPKTGAWAAFGLCWDPVVAEITKRYEARL